MSRDSGIAKILDIELKSSIETLDEEISDYALLLDNEFHANGEYNLTYVMYERFIEVLNKIKNKLELSLELLQNEGL